MVNRKGFSWAGQLPIALCLDVVKWPSGSDSLHLVKDQVDAAFGHSDTVAACSKIAFCGCAHLEILSLWTIMNLYGAPSGDFRLS